MEFDEEAHRPERFDFVQSRGFDHARMRRIENDFLPRIENPIEETAIENPDQAPDPFLGAVPAAQARRYRRLDKDRRSLIGAQAGWQFLDHCWSFQLPTGGMVQPDRFRRCMISPF